MNKYNSVCRSCLVNKDDLINPYTEYDPAFEQKYVDEYYMCTNIVIKKSDSLPKMMCQNCVAELKIAYSFQKRAKKSNDILLKYLRKSRNKDSEVLHHNNTAMRVKTEHGYSFISISSVSDAPAEFKTKWDDSNESEFVVSLAGSDNEESDEENSNEFKISILKVEQDEVLSVTCVKCNEFFVNNELLQEHIEQKHASQTETHNYHCSVCKEDFENDQELDDHIAAVHSFNFLCNICGSSFASETLLTDHFTANHRENPFVDDADLQGDEEDENETRFMLENADDQTITESLMAKKSKIPKFLCSICGKSFTTNQRLRIHTYTHTGERNYECDQCSKRFATEFRLRSHQRTHTGERPYECETCGLRFAQVNALKCHKRVHTGEKPYECRYCSKKFSQNTILKTHMTLHTGKTIQCPDCDKKFSRASYLILHRREHTGEKPYACDRCPNRYKQKSHLDRHMDIHNGVRYKCTVCNKEYSKQYSLKMHMFSHTAEKPFNCSHCPATFTRGDRYKSHLKLRHLDE